jgi:hypothetical protein
MSLSLRLDLVARKVLASQSDDWRGFAEHAIPDDRGGTAGRVKRYCDAVSGVFWPLTSTPDSGTSTG